MAMAAYTAPVAGRTMDAPKSYDTYSGGGAALTPSHSVGAMNLQSMPSGTGASGGRSSSTLAQGLSQLTLPANVAPVTIDPATTTSTTESTSRGSRNSRQRGGFGREQPGADPMAGGPGQSLGYLAQFFEQLRAQYPMAGSGGLINEGLMPWRQDMGGIRAPSA